MKPLEFLPTDVRTYSFEMLGREPGIVHGVFSRLGGNSEKPFDSLNIGLKTGDVILNVQHNRKRIAKEMGMIPLIYLNQVHGDAIQVLKRDDNDLSERFEPGADIYTADGVITDIGKLGLVIQVADCQSVMMYEPEKKVIANVHSGWRGSVANIIGRAVDLMVSVFGCRPEIILAGVSPSLGPCCGEFRHYRDEIPRHLWPYKTEDRDNFDFWRMSRDQLTAKGVKADHIETMELCTRCHAEVFYSYRAERKTGRFACVIAMDDA